MVNARLASRARRRERGAAVFVVVMAVTMLTAVGLFAAHSATMVDEAAGYNRLARQTQLIAEYGTLAAATELSAGAADSYMTQMRAGVQTCVANMGVVGQPCYRFDYSTLNTKTKALSNESLSKDPSGTVEDVIATGNVRADFAIEIHDPGAITTLVAGSGEEFKYVPVVATSLAQVRPVGVTACSASTPSETGVGAASVTGQNTMRAHLLVGPVSAPN